MSFPEFLPWIILEARGGIEPPIKVLQTFALPLGDRAPGENRSGDCFNDLLDHQPIPFPAANFSLPSRHSTSCCLKAKNPPAMSTSGGGSKNAWAVRLLAAQPPMPEDTCAQHILQQHICAFFWGFSFIFRTIRITLLFCNSTFPSQILRVLRPPVFLPVSRLALSLRTKETHARLPSVILELSQHLISLRARSSAG
jgi:hypothetical protein